MVIKKTIRQAPTYFDHLYKVVSPYEMSPHEIENLKRLLWTQSLLNHFIIDPRVKNKYFTC